MPKVTISALALVFLGAAVHAEDKPYSQRYDSCMDNSGGVTVEMHDCIGDEQARQDARLDQAYRKLASQLSASRRKELLTAQRVWIQYRDANCGFYADPEGGTMAAIDAASCGLETTARRAKELENLGE